MILDEIVKTLGFPRNEIVIVDDRMIRGIRYGNLHGYPTIWFQNGKFSGELLNNDTGEPTFIIHSLSELPNILTKKKIMKHLRKHLFSSTLKKPFQGFTVNCLLLVDLEG